MTELVKRIKTTDLQPGQVISFADLLQVVIEVRLPEPPVVVAEIDIWHQNGERSTGYSGIDAYHNVIVGRID